VTALAALLLAAQSAAPQAAPPPPWLADAMAQFGSACVERGLPDNAAEISRSELPGALRVLYRRASAARFHRLGGERASYLIQGTNPSRGAASACAVAVPDRSRLAILFGALLQFEPRATQVFGVNYNLNANIVGDYVVIEIAHHADSRN
jgi:hypothetical protein